MPDTARESNPDRQPQPMMSFDDAQAEMRQGHLCGAPGIAVSGLVLLAAAGVGLAMMRARVAAGALAGAAIELVFAALVFAQARRRTAA